MTALFLRLVSEICFDFRNAGSLKVLVSGFRPADGIRRELVSPYSCEAENEDRARDIFRQEFNTDEQV